MEQEQVFLQMRYVLARCRIKVQATQEGRPKGVLRLNGEEVFTFEKNGSYWIATGDVPLSVANELYDDPLGYQDIRVIGDAGRRSPELWNYGGVIPWYHIDSESGLRVFVDTLRNHNLVDL